MEFPKEANEAQRAVLIAGVLNVNYQQFERKGGGQLDHSVKHCNFTSNFKLAKVSKDRPLKGRLKDDLGL